MPSRIQTPICSPILPFSKAPTIDALFLILLFSEVFRILLSSWHCRFLQSARLSPFPPRSILGLVCPNMEELEIEGEAGEERWCYIVPLFSFQVSYNLRYA